jgi:hypothetical protein
MRTYLLHLLVLSLFLSLAGRAGAQGEAKAIIEKALKAHGGADKIAKLKAAQVAAKGTIDVNGMNLEFTAESYAQLPNQFKSVMKLKAGGMDFTQVQSMNRDKIVITLNGMEVPLTDKTRDEIKETVYAERVANLIPLIKEKEFQLSLLGEAQVDGRPAVGVKASSKGHKDVNLYFDKESGLLVKTEYRSLDAMSNQEYTREQILKGYKEFNGIQSPTRLVINKDGKKLVEMEVTDVKNLEKLDDSVFEP